MTKAIPNKPKDPEGLEPPRFFRDVPFESPIPLSRELAAKRDHQGQQVIIAE
jgi:hypothetical protein